MIRGFVKSGVRMVCGGCGSDACHQATVNWLNSEVEVYNPSTANAVSIHSVKEGKSDVGGEKMDGKGEVRFPDPPKEEML